MKTTQILIAGFGGQGILFAGKPHVLCRTGRSYRQYAVGG